MSTPVPGEDDRLSVRAALANESMESVLWIWSSTLPCRMLHSSAPWDACALASSIAFAAKAAGHLAQCVSPRGRCFYRQKGTCFSGPSFERLRDVSSCKVDPAPKFPAGFPSSREGFPANLAGNSTTRRGGKTLGGNSRWNSSPSLENGGEGELQQSRDCR